jgi:cell division protein FtsX
MTIRRRSLLSSLALLSSALLVCTSQPQQKLAYAQTSSTTANTAAVTRLKADVDALTRFRSRVPGSPDYSKAAAYVEGRFRQLGLQDVVSEEYEVTVPQTRVASISVGGAVLPLLPIYPNHVVPSTTPEAGIQGRLIYGGRGNPVDFNGKLVEDSIVALDFDSGMNWITAADLGARAVIFLEPANGSTRSEAERKFASLPVELPRFYAPRATADAIRSGSASALLKAHVLWETVPARNIIGVIPGTDAELSKQTIVMNGYFDSMSITPDLAPGAEAAANCAALFEVIRYFKANPSKYTLMFVANGAHHVALAGVRNFAKNHLVDTTGTADDATKDKIKAIRAFVGLDITSRTPTVGLFAKAAFYNQMVVGATNAENILLNQFNSFAKTVYELAQADAQKRGTQVEEFFVDGVRGLEGRTWRSYLPSLVALDSEVATMAQKPGISFATVNDARIVQDTPFDTAEKLNLSNVAIQTDTITRLLSQAFATGDEKTNVFQTLPAGKALSAIFGYAVTRSIYRNTKEGGSFLPDTPLPDAKLPGANKAGTPYSELYKNSRAVAFVLDRTKDHKSYSGVRGAFIERASYSKARKGFPASSQFLILGPRVGDTKGGGSPLVEVETYAVDGDGRVNFAPDMGSERNRFTPTFNKTAPLKYKDKASGEYEVAATTICFEARGVSFYDTLDQRYFQILREMTVLDGKTDANPVEYGFLRPQTPTGVAAQEPMAVVFGLPGARFKLIMAQGLLGKRLIVIQTRPTTGKSKDTIVYEGAGVSVPVAEDPPGKAVNRLSYMVARDLWTLDQQRIDTLKKFGINNERVDMLHNEAGGKSGEAISAPTGGAIGLAEKALADMKYDVFYAQARQAFGIESRAYPDVEATAQDVLKGIIFYLALLLPFAFFLERLLFGYPDIRSQIIAATLLFLGVFFGISRVHPAFELATTPFIILLAFIILALTVVVTTFLSSKFEAEIKRLKQGVHFADVGRLSAISAALGLGIANMRRRPTRTALTCVTLVLLTFTVLSFTSVTASISNFARPYGTTEPPYAGMLVRQPDWSALQERAVDSMANEFQQKFGQAPALRSWYLSRDQAEPLHLRVSNVQNQQRYFHAPALLGMTPQEALIGSPVVKTLMPGSRWFKPGERNVVLLPRAVLVPEEKSADAEGAATTEGAATEATPAPTATTPAPTATAATDTDAAADAPAEEKKPSGPADGLALGLTLENAIGSTIQVAGEHYKVIGIFDDAKWSPPTAMRDLDDEPFAPVDYQDDQNKRAAQDQATTTQQGNEVQVQTYQHMSANAILVMPYDDVIALGGTPRSVAVGFGNNVPQGEEELQALMQRAALGIFGSVPDKENGDKLSTKLYSSVESTSYEGFAALIVPIAIAALIIANTMLGSVFERTREIGIYSSVGLAPIHVAALFIAEAIVYAVLGSISGYLVAQTVAKIVTSTNLLPGITLNYSSSSAVLSTLIVMATVLASTIYPAKQASRMSQPDIERKWQMSVPLGDLWRFQFPFTVSGQQPLGVAQFLADFFETHTDTSIGSFYTDKVNFSSLRLRQAVELLNELPPGVTLPPEVPKAVVASGSALSADGVTQNASSQRPDAGVAEVSNSAPGGDKKKKKAIGGPPPPSFKLIHLDQIAANPDTEIYWISMRVWLAPFDMGVSQDVDILLMPADEPGLYELQLRLMRQSGETSAWRRVNRQFMSDLRKQLLLWRTIRPEGQQEYILRGRAHVTGQIIPSEEPGAVVGAGV